MTARFRILGSCAATGVPSFFCDCIGCREAKENPKYERTRPGAVVDTGNTRLLIDASPDIRSQLVKESINRVDAIFLTHWHADHYSGLGEFEFFVKLLTKEPLDLYLPNSAVDEFALTFPHLLEVFRVIPWEFQKKYVFGDISLTPLQANHGIETAGFLVESKKTRLAYFPDTAGLPAGTAQKLLGIHYLICDATFYGDNWYPHSHMNVEQAVALGRSIKARHTILTHLSIHYSQPVTTAKLEEELAGDYDVMVAYDGLSIELK